MNPFAVLVAARRTLAALGLLATLLPATGCAPSSPDGGPTITVTATPAAAVGGRDRMARIAGRVTAAQPGDRVVLFAHSGVWWVQPLASTPFTEIAPDGTWSAETHLGTEYAALLVAAGYEPQPTLDHLPGPGGQVRAIHVASGTGDPHPTEARRITFSGYDWDVRDAPSDRGGANYYDARNAEVDEHGRLHLRLTRRDGRWTGAEISLSRPLGYGTYAFVTADTSSMPPAAVLGLVTWDDGAAEHNHRELDVEISRWGDPGNDNAQFVVQPYYVAANVRRFATPAGALRHTLRWSPDQAAFHTLPVGGRTPIAAHTFTSGVPVPGDERVRIHLYVFGYTSTPLRDDVEVVVESFQYLP